MFLLEEKLLEELLSARSPSSTFLSLLVSGAARAFAGAKNERSAVCVAAAKVFHNSAAFSAN